MRNHFVKILEEDEDDTATRLVFADWLDDHGEHEEADRHRQWPAAKKWMMDFCEKYEPELEPDDIDESDFIGYEQLIILGHVAFADSDNENINIPCGWNIKMSNDLNNCVEVFWKNWSIVTGRQITKEIVKKTYFMCCV